MQIPSLRKPKFLKRISEYWTKIPSNLKQALSILLILVLATALWLFLAKRTTTTREELQVIQPTPAVTLITTPIPTPTPTPRPIPSGRQIFNLSHGKSVKGPRISQLIVDPLNPFVGGTQIVTVKIAYTSPITEVKARLDTDSMNKSYTFKRIAGSDTDGTWQASWKMEDSYDYIYYLFFELASETDTYKGGFPFR
ncbi:hypothetical protein KAT60_01525 [Candidatus Woesebacteria bacterium]|nr:hypothetical protein [Candidatus Woesebacteria bacterium]